MPWVLLETTVALQGRVMSIQMYIEEVMWLILKMWTSRGKLSGQENTKIWWHWIRVCERSSGKGMVIQVT